MLGWRSTWYYTSRNISLGKAQTSKYCWGTCEIDTIIIIVNCKWTAITISLTFYMLKKILKKNILHILEGKKVSCTEKVPNLLPPPLPFIKYLMVCPLAVYIKIYLFSDYLKVTRPFQLLSDGWCFWKWRVLSIGHGKTWFWDGFVWVYW